MAAKKQKGGGVETLRWKDGALEVIDQRVLPAEIVFRRCESAEEVAAVIRDMVIRGAPAIGCAAAYGIAVEARREQGSKNFDAAMILAFDKIAASRPTAVNLFWALDRMGKVLGANSRENIAARLLDEAHAIFAEDVAANRKMGGLGAKLLKDGARVLTHCNAGSLATAGHGTALGVIRSAVENGKSISVIVSETRPYLQGARLTTWEMMQEGIPVTLITDSMAGHFMARGEIDAVIVGADRIAANGDVANKIGTYTLAVLAKRHGIPFYVAAPTSTIDLSIPTGESIPIEERSPDEVTGYRGSRWAAEGVSVRNPAFDVTPAELVSAIITERGIVKKPNTKKMRAMFSNKKGATRTPTNKRRKPERKR